MGNFNGYGMWGGGWGQPYQRRPMQRPMQTGGAMPAMPYSPQMGGPMPANPYGPAMGGNSPRVGLMQPGMQTQRVPYGFGGPDMPISLPGMPPEAAFMRQQMPGNDRESRMNRFADMAQRFLP